jgi:hypothetical protein
MCCTPPETNLHASGFGIESLTLDVMHIMDLGVSQFVLGALFKQLVDANFVRSTAVRYERRRHENISHLRRRIKSFYKAQGLYGKKLSCMNNITYKQLGNSRRPCLKAKAAESRNLVPLSRLIAAENANFLGKKGAYVKAACDELCNFFCYYRKRTEGDER